MISKTKINAFIASTLALIIVISPAGTMALPSFATIVYSQNDRAWSSYKWKYNSGGGASPLVESGCGPTSIAMVVRSLTGKKTTPKTVAKKYSKYHSRNGIEHRAFEKMYSDYGLSGGKLNNLDDAARFLENDRSSATSQGAYVIIATDSGLTGGGHVAVLTRYKNGKFKLLDPKYSKNSRYWSRSEFKNQDVKFSGFWGYTKKKNIKDYRG